jgi:hypothetical protein
VLLLNLSGTSQDARRSEWRPNNEVASHLLDPRCSALGRTGIRCAGWLFSGISLQSDWSLRQWTRRYRAGGSRKGHPTMYI